MIDLFTKKKEPLSWALNHTPLLMLVLAAMGGLAAIFGGLFFVVSQSFISILLTLIVLFICRTYFLVYTRNHLVFYYLLLMTGAYIYLSFKNYVPVVIGGQDPGYYQAFGKVLSHGHGSSFDPQLYESIIPELPYSFWSIYTDANHSEIEFYPFLPALIGSITYIFGGNSYLVLSVLSNILCVAIVHKYLHLSKKDVNGFIPALWFFIPATLWITRTPASEISSIPLTVLALLYPLYRIKYQVMNCILLLFLSFSLVLSRANPLSVIMLVGISLWIFLAQSSSVHRAIDLILEVSMICLGSAIAAWVISQSQPNFWNSLLIGTYIPFLKYLMLLCALTVVLILLNDRNVRVGKKTAVDLIRRYSFLQIPFLVTTVMLATAYVLFSNKWGVYAPNDFGISNLPFERMNHTLLFFVLSSFFVSIALLRSPKDEIQSLLYLTLVFFILATAARSPGIPYSYYFQRYWWSEVGLLFWLLICLTSANHRISFLKRSFPVSFLVISLTISFQVSTFGRAIVANTEGGTLTSNAFSEFVSQNLTPGAVLLISETAEPSFISQVVVPLRYYYDVKISTAPNSNYQAFNKRGVQIVSDVDCSAMGRQKTTDIPVLRLRDVGSKSFGSWIMETRRVYLCTIRGQEKMC
jgi:hypothetical protein